MYTRISKCYYQPLTWLPQLWKSRILCINQKFDSRHYFTNYFWFVIVYIHCNIEEQGEQSLIVYCPANEPGLIKLWGGLPHYYTQTDTPEQQAQLGWKTNINIMTKPIQWFLNHLDTFFICVSNDDQICCEDSVITLGSKPSNYKIINENTW